jgi:hypothetical protein
MNAMAILIAIGVGIASCLTVYHSIKQVGRVEGQQTERARVVTQEKKTNDRIASKQRAAAKQPANRVLDRWSTD